MPGPFSLGKRTKRKEKKETVAKGEIRGGKKILRFSRPVIHQVSNKSWVFLPRSPPAARFAEPPFIRAQATVEKYNLSRGSQSDLISCTLFFRADIFFPPLRRRAYVSLTCIYYTNACYNNSDSCLMDYVDPFLLLLLFFFSFRFVFLTTAFSSRPSEKTIKLPRAFTWFVIPRCFLLLLMLLRVGTVAWQRKLLPFLYRLLSAEISERSRDFDSGPYNRRFA